MRNLEEIKKKKEELSQSVVQTFELLKVQKDPFAQSLLINQIQSMQIMIQTIDWVINSQLIQPTNDELHRLSK